MRQLIMRYGFLILPLLMCSMCSAQLTQLSKPSLVHVRLAADTSAIQGGKPFRIGLVYDISPGWHIYWTNPGDAGMATSVTFHFPPGFKAGPITFPLPSRFELPGGIVCYGYHSQLVLMTTVTPPADLKTDQQVLVSADTKYLVCNDVCINGKQTTSTMLTVSPNRGLRNIELFDHWSSLIPQPADQCSLVHSVTSDDSSVTIQWNQTVKNVEFFPGASQAVSIGHITVLNEGKQTQVLFVPKYYDKSKVQPVSCIVGFVDPRGIERAIDFSIPLKGTF